MSPTATTNGKPRKQLSEQLDRLDNTIEGLASGLPEAVAEACKEGARQAIKDAIIEIVTNPELRALIAPLRPEPVPVPQPAPAPEPKPGIWTRVKAKLAAAREAVANTARRAKEAIIRRSVIAGEMVVAVGKATGEHLPLRRVLLVGLGVGLVVGIGCLVVPQTTAAVVGGMGAACTSVSVQVGRWLGRAARRLGLVP